MRFPLLLGAVGFLATAGCVYAPPPGYRVVPVASAQPVSTCHDVSQTVTIDGKQQQAMTSVCQQPNGSWQVNNGPAAAPSEQAVATDTFPDSYYPYYGYSAAYDPIYPYGYYGWYPGFGGSIAIGGYGYGGRYYGGHYGGHYSGGHYGHGGGGHHR